MSSHPDQTTLTNELIQSGYITIPQMQQALIESRKSGRSLLEMLPEITGRALPPDILHQHEKQKLFNLKLLHGVEYFDHSMKVDGDKVAKIIDSLGILELCYRHQMLPLKLYNQKPPVLKMAMVDPSHTEVLNDLKQRLKRKGAELQRLGITPEDYQQLSQEIYPKLDGSEQLMKQSQQVADQTIVDVTEVFEQMPPHLDSLDEEENLNSSDQSEVSPVVNLVNKILTKALETKASAIHIDPQENLLSVRFRQDGILQSVFGPLPVQLSSAVIGRLKVMAELDNVQKHTGQKGRIRKNFAGRSVDFLLNILPGQRGEKAILKIIDHRTVVSPLSQLVQSTNTENGIKNLLRRSSGLVIVTGTALSGKSSTLYSLLDEKNQMGLSVVTVEDPIERTIADVTQVEVNTAKERTYSRILQSLLRQDVDVILVDRLEDGEVAHYLSDAAARGRYVITGLEAASVPDAIAQLQQLGATPSLLADTLIGVINQRLVRRLCPTCRLAYQPSPDQLAKFGLTSSSRSHQTFYRANVLNPTAIEQAQQKGRLCRTCDGKGYKGQMGIFEVFEVTPSLKALIAQNATPERLLKVAVQEGMQPLLSHALTLVQQGDTTLEEIERVLDNQLLLSSSTSGKVTQTPNTQVMSRIEAIEKLLVQVTCEFEQLKQSLSVSDEPSSPPIHQESEVILTPTDTPSRKTPPEEEINFYEQTIAYGETIASPDALYEELNDPGDWNDLRQELDPSKETMAINFSDEDDDENDDYSFHPNPFKSVPDPW